MTFILDTLRKEQLTSKNISPNTIRGVINFTGFNPSKVLAGDIWISSVDGTVTVNDVTIYFQDSVIANIKNPGPLTLTSIAQNKWSLSRKRLYTYGTMKTGVNGGVLFEGYMDDDYTYLCVVGGPVGTAIWKKQTLLRT